MSKALHQTRALSMSGDMPCLAAAAIANLISMNTAPALGERSRPSLELLRNTPEFSRELPAGAGELNNPVSPTRRGLGVRLTRRPGQRGQHYAPTGSFLGRLDKKFRQRDIDVDIVEFEVEGGPHVGRAYDARCRVVLPSHPPQFLAFGEGHPQPAVAAFDGAFGRDFSGHSPNFTTTARGGGGHARRVFSVNFYLDCVVGKSLHPGRPGHRLAHRKGPLNAENAARTTGLLTAGRTPGGRTDPVCQPLTTKATTLLSRGNYPPSAGLWPRLSPLGGWFFAIGAPMGHSQPLAPVESNRTPSG